MSHPLQENLDAVTRWLEENVASFSTPAQVTLSGFKLRGQQFAGYFSVCLDQIEIVDRFSFGLGINGKPELFLPMFYSPLGTPASYAAVTLTQETRRAIEQALEHILPKMKPLGLERETGQCIGHSTAHRDRAISPLSYDQQLDALHSNSFSFTIDVEKSLHR